MKPNHLQSLSHMATPIKVILVDDHSILLDGIEMLLAPHRGINVIGKAQSGQDLFANHSLDEADLIVMDINMKGDDGIEVFKKAKANGYQGTCIFLSSYDDLKLVDEVTKLGATGYLTKSSASDCLEEAILQVNKGEQYFSPEIKKKILASFSHSKSDQKDYQEEGLLRQLTNREIEVLKQIALQYTSEEISKQLFIAKSTVDTHRKNLINKLNVKNAVGLGLFAKRNGII